jgi:hypothetical protein
LFAAPGLALVNRAMQTQDPTGLTFRDKGVKSPIVERGLGDAHLPAYLPRLRAQLDLLQREGDLLGREFARFHTEIPLTNRSPFVADFSNFEWPALLGVGHGSNNQDDEQKPVNARVGLIG